MHCLTIYERALLDRLVAENERQRRRPEGDAHSQIPAHDTAIPAPERRRPPSERPQAIIIDFQ